MMIKYSVLFLVVAGLLASCNRKNLKYDKPYFDFDSLVKAQTISLERTKIKVIKTSSLNGKRDSVSFTPDTTQWKHELNAFQQIDIINKPLFKGEYTLVESKDDHSNLRVRTYSTTKKSPVPWVKFYYLDNWQKLKKIETKYYEQNQMFSSARKLTLEFDSQGSDLIINHYRVQGFQKMILSDSVLFLLDGKTIQ